MGASLYYRQDKPIIGIGINTGAPSSFFDKLAEAVGQHNCENICLGDDHIAILEGMSVFNKDYRQLISAINQLGDIVVYREY